MNSRKLISTNQWRLTSLSNLLLTRLWNTKFRNLNIEIAGQGQDDYFRNLIINRNLVCGSIIVWGGNAVSLTAIKTMGIICNRHAC
jgi:hypothetical protein